METQRLRRFRTTGEKGNRFQAPSGRLRRNLCVREIAKELRIAAGSRRPILHCVTSPNRSGAIVGVFMRYLFGFLCVCALGVMPLVGCSETTGDGGSGGDAGSGGVGGEAGSDGRWDNWFWEPYDCPGCQCEGDYGLIDFTTTLDCFCCRYHCEPGLGPFGNGLIDSQTIIEYDCDRRYSREFAENPEISFLIDTTTNEVVAASYSDDCCICFDGYSLSAGDWGLEGCQKISERTCSGPCDVGAFEVQP